MAELSGKSHAVRMLHDVLLREERYMIFLLSAVSSTQ
nr:MAG TPA: Shikimate kinase [Caudoviricetes sp.]